MKEDEGGSFPVSRIPHFELQLSEGLRIALKIWYPSSDSDRTFFPEAEEREALLKAEAIEKASAFPAILEYIPYRHSDFTVCRDEARHPWMASHGYVIVRADLRGSGNSNGLFFDEYTETEQRDGIAIIEWLKTQSWSNGRVGMYGKSWGGFNGLQIAFRDSKALSSVISLYSTDNRFTDDIHYKGGCVIGSGMLSWASCMLADQTKPPHPKYMKNWKEEWKNRLENACESWADIWLSKPSFDNYWAHGSICTDYERIQIPIMIVGGWVDAYTNAAFRMAERLPKVTSIIGPWSHDWPDVAVPGPNIGFLQKCLQFWEATLRDSKDIEEEHVWYQIKGISAPSEWTKQSHGRWLRLKKDIKYADAVEAIHFNIQAKGPRVVEQTKDALDLCLEESEEYITLKVDPLSAQEYNEFLSFGDPDQAGDMGLININHSDTWILEIPISSKEPLSLLGRPVFEGIVQGSQIIVRLCDVFPDGQARLLSLGVMNLEDNLEKRKIKIEMDVHGYDVQPDHVLALSFSPMYFPLIWPSKTPPGLRLYEGTLTLSKLRPDVFETNFDPEEPICFKHSPLRKELREPEYQRTFNTLHDGQSDSYTYEWKTLVDSGEEELIHERIVTSEKREETYRISSAPPFNPEAETTWSVHMSFPTRNPDVMEKISIQTTSKMISNDGSEDKKRFFSLHHVINVCHGEEALLSKDYKKVIPR